MSFLGRDGIVQFSRELPSPLVLPASALDRTNHRLLINSDTLWPCELVVLIGNVSGVATAFSGYLHKDSLDRVSLHPTMEEACVNSASTRISLASLQQKATILFAANEAAQTAQLLSFYTSTILPSDSAVQQELTLADWPAAETAYLAAGDQFTDWKAVAMLRSWSFTTSSSVIDTSSIGDKFSEAEKSTVTGSGSFDFIVELFGSQAEYSPEAILRLALMTERGCAGNGKLYLCRERTDTPSYRGHSSSNRALVRSSVYYNVKMLISNTVTDVSADGIVQGSADFVTTGPISLRLEKSSQ